MGPVSPPLAVWTARRGLVAAAGAHVRMVLKALKEGRSRCLGSTLCGTCLPVLPRCVCAVLEEKERRNAVRLYTALAGWLARERAQEAPNPKLPAHDSRDACEGLAAPPLTALGRIAAVNRHGRIKKGAPHTMTGVCTGGRPQGKGAIQPGSVGRTDGAGLCVRMVAQPQWASHTVHCSSPHVLWPAILFT